MLSPRHVQELRTLVANQQVRCVFSEAEWANKNELVQTVIAGTNAKSAVLDPLGAGVQAGSQAYFQLMRELAGTLRDCLLK